MELFQQCWLFNLQDEYLLKCLTGEGIDIAKFFKTKVVFLSCCGKN